MNLGRWLLVVAAVALLVGLVIEARGEKHHHGDEVGTHAQSQSTAPHLGGTDV